MAKKPKKPDQSQPGNGDATPPSGEGKVRRRRRAPKSWSQTHGRDIKFLGIFLGLVGLYFAATTTSFMNDQFFPWYLRLNAEASGLLLNAMGYDDVSVRDQSLIGAFRMQIARGCDGMDPSALFIAAVLASPVAFRRKLPALLIGTGLLLVLNVLRIVTLYFTGLYLPKYFDIAHLDVWQAAFIIMALLFWAAWAHWIAHQSQRQRTHAPA